MRPWLGWHEARESWQAQAGGGPPGLHLALRQPEQGHPVMLADHMGQAQTQAYAAGPTEGATYPGGVRQQHAPELEADGQQRRVKQQDEQAVASTSGQARA